MNNLENVMEKYEKKRETYIKAIRKLAYKYDLVIGTIHEFDAPTTDSIGVVGDWNSPKMEWLRDIVEKYDDVYFVYIKWEDEIHYCDECGIMCDISPSFYGAEVSYISVSINNESFVVCRTCFNLEDCLEVFLNNPDMAIPVWAVKQAESEDLGFFPLDGRYETGFHTGQDDSPKDMLLEVQKRYPNFDFLFHIIEVSQFYVVWGILARKKEECTEEK